MSPLGVTDPIPLPTTCCSVLVSEWSWYEPSYPDVTPSPCPPPVPLTCAPLLFFHWCQNESGVSPLGVAVGFNRIEMVQLLLDKSVDLMQRDKGGNSVLHYAAG